MLLKYFISLTKLEITLKGNICYLFQLLAYRFYSQMHL